jgi:hypothetical protein
VAFPHLPHTYTPLDLSQHLSSHKHFAEAAGVSPRKRATWPLRTSWHHSKQNEEETNSLIKKNEFKKTKKDRRKKHGPGPGKEQTRHVSAYEAMH